MDNGSRIEGYLGDILDTLSGAGVPTVGRIDPASRIERYLEDILDALGGGASSVEYTTEAPSSANESGLKFAVLDEEPAAYRDGWVYFITED